MNRTTKIAMAATGVLVVGGVIYAVTASSDAPSKKSSTPKKVKPPRAPPPPTLVWNEQLQKEMADVAREEWRKSGSPEWNNRDNLELARTVAKRMYPTSPITQADGWPKTDSQSSLWHSQSDRQNPGASAWRRAFQASALAMGFVYVT